MLGPQFAMAIDHLVHPQALRDLCLVHDERSVQTVEHLGCAGHSDVRRQQDRTVDDTVAAQLAQVLAPMPMVLRCASR